MEKNNRTASRIGRSLFGTRKRFRRMVVSEEMKIEMKIAASKASPSIVGILSRHLPHEMAEDTIYGQTYILSKEEIEEWGELVFWGSGIIYESHKEDDTTLDYFNSIIICAATLFFRTDALQPPLIQVNVYLCNGEIVEGRVIACDFHNNLAAIRIRTPFKLQTPTLRNLDDFVPLNLTPIQKKLLVTQPLQHPPHPRPTTFKVSPGTPLLTIARCQDLLNGIIFEPGEFSPTTCRRKWDFSELYWVQSNDHPNDRGGAVINILGEVVGLLFGNFSLLPINLVSTWWKNFKSRGQYHQPYIGMKIGNLHVSRSDYLKEFLAEFPDVTGGVVVLEVAEDSPAYRLGIRSEDVIVKCDGKLVRSSLEFFEIIWSNVEIEHVELEVRRVKDGKTRKLSLKVEQTPPDKMNKWVLTAYTFFTPFEPVQE